METIVQAPVDYARLDAPDAATRIRLSSTTVRVGHGGRTSSEAGPHTSPVSVVYMRDGKTHAVSARHVVLACYNALIPGLVPDLPEPQKRALLYSPKVPMMYNNVLIRNWTAFQKLGASSISAPGLYHTSTSLDPGSTVGGYRGVSLFLLVPIGILISIVTIVVSTIASASATGLPCVYPAHGSRYESVCIGSQRLRDYVEQYHGGALG